MARSSNHLNLLSILPVVLMAGVGCKRSRPVGTRVCKRVISLLPSATETLFAIGAGKTVVAVTRFDDFPPQVKKLPRVGGIIDASPEAILGHSPDCVVGPPSLLAGLKTRLQAIRARPVTVDYSAIKQVFASTITLGKATGHLQQAQRLIKTLKQGLQAINTRSRGKKRPSVLFVAGLHPIYVAGPDSFIGFMLKTAGATNCVTRGKFPNWSLEQVIKSRPDLVLIFQEKCGPIPSDVLKWPIAAVKNRHVRVLCDNSLVRPGPRLVHAVTKLYDLIHHDSL